MKSDIEYKIKIDEKDKKYPQKISIDITGKTHIIKTCKPYFEREILLSDGRITDKLNLTILVKEDELKKLNERFYSKQKNKDKSHKLSFSAMELTGNSSGRKIEKLFKEVIKNYGFNDNEYKISDEVRISTTKPDEKSMYKPKRPATLHYEIILKNKNRSTKKSKSVHEFSINIHVCEENKNFYPDKEIIKEYESIEDYKNNPYGISEKLLKNMNDENNEYRKQFSLMIKESKKEFHSLEQYSLNNKAVNILKLTHNILEKTEEKFNFDEDKEESLITNFKDNYFIDIEENVIENNHQNLKKIIEKSEIKNSENKSLSDRLRGSNEESKLKNIGITNDFGNNKNKEIKKNNIEEKNNVIFKQGYKKN